MIYLIVTLVPGHEVITATLENLGRDDRFRLAEGDWVEVVDDDYVLKNGYEPLLKVLSIDLAEVKLAGTLQTAVGKDPTKHPLLRRWDHKARDPHGGGLELGSDNAALIIEGTGESNWLELEDGIKIQFQKLDTDPMKQSQYRTGDYWLIPARTATGDVEWRREKDSQGNLVPIAKKPDGVEHHYAPLAVISVHQNGVNVHKPPCQNTFEPMAKPITP